MDGRHVVLDFYDLLIEPIIGNNRRILLGESPENRTFVKQEFIPRLGRYTASLHDASIRGRPNLIAQIGRASILRNGMRL